MRLLSRLPLAAKVSALAALLITLVAAGAAWYAVAEIGTRMDAIVESQLNERMVSNAKAVELGVPGAAIERNAAGDL
ncbi:hypothetical protein ABTF68_21300, partial [Acinetobacter baumannii]